MPTDSERDDLPALWQSQAPTGFRMHPDDIRRRIEQMETSSRRTVIDFYLFFGAMAIFVIFFAAVSPNALLTSGAALTILGLGCLTWLVRRNNPPAEASASIDHYRMLLERRRDFALRGVWLRVLAIAPGPLLFSLGLAAAYPKAAPMVWFQIATFVIVLVAIFPINRRAAAKVQRQIDELGRLGE
jgi:hypothetical protein